MPTPDPAALPGEAWTGRTGDAWAEEWRRTDRSFAMLTDHLLDSEGLGAFGAALDIGCGAGELVLRLAKANPGSSVCGIDISAPLLDVARARCAELPNASFEQVDAALWRAGARPRPDLFVSRHGVMFFPDPQAAFSRLRGEAASTARLRFSCFRSREENEWVGALVAILPTQPAPSPPDSTGPFAFGDPGRVRAILSDAGWKDIAFEAVDYLMIAGEGPQALDEALGYFQRIGPAARAIAELPDHERPAARQRLRGVLEGYHHEHAVTLGAAAWIVTARA